ncbi:MAG: class I SAM-dependent methyltransferase [Tissierellia bacterium]|nr:class I SAM-dependent methyltransferase [Tissierellia bacterium]
MSKVYGNFAWIYDDFMEDYDYEGVFHFIDQVWDHPKKEEASILEMACGTGSLSCFLSGWGQLDAFDLSPDMLALAQAKLGHREGVRLFQMDMETFRLDRTYDLILCLCDSMNYLDHKDKIFRTLVQVQKHLKQDGLFIMDLNTAHGFEKNYGDQVFLQEKEGVFLAWDNHFDRDLGINYYDLDFFLEEEGGLYRRFSESHEEYTYSIEEIRELVQKAGLRILKMTQGYSQEEDLSQAGRIVYFIKKEDV